MYGMYAFHSPLPIQRFIRFLYTSATMANDNATTILVFIFVFCFGSTNDTFKYLQLLYFKIVFLVYFNHMPFCQIPSHSAHTAPN